MTTNTTTYTIPTSIKEGVKTLLDKGATKEKVEGYLLFEEVPKKEAIKYLKELGLIGKVTFRKWLTTVCLDGFLGYEEFSTKIKGESDNVQKHLSVYNNERKAYNSIHAKYNKDIATLVEADKSDEDELSDK